MLSCLDGEPRRGGGGGGRGRGPAAARPGTAGVAESVGWAEVRRGGERSAGVPARGRKRAGSNPPAVLPFLIHQKISAAQPEKTRPTRERKGGPEQRKRARREPEPTAKLLRAGFWFWFLCSDEFPDTKAMCMEGQPRGTKGGAGGSHLAGEGHGNQPGWQNFPLTTFLEIWLWEESTYAQGKTECILFIFSSFF